MSKKIEDYLHLYLGCEVLVAGDSPRATLGAVGIRNGEMVILRWGGLGEWSYADTAEIKPILRRLDSITKEEMSEVETYKHEGEWVTDYAGNMAESSIARVPIIDMAKTTHYLLSKHFDLFGLIDAGLASDAATI